MMMVLAVVVSIRGMGPTSLRVLTVLVVLFRVGGLAFVMEPAMMAKLTGVVEPLLGVGVTKVVGPTMMSPAAVVVLIMKGCLIIGVVGGDGAMRRSWVKGCGGVGGVAGEGIVRGALELAMVVRFAMMMGHAMVMGLVMAVGSSVTWSVVWGW